MRQDKINTLLMKQDFVVHKQQEPQEKKTEYRNIVTCTFKRPIKDWNHALKIILVTGDEKFNQRTFFLMNDFFFSFVYRSEFAISPLL